MKKKRALSYRYETETECHPFIALQRMHIEYNVNKMKINEMYKVNCTMPPPMECTALLLQIRSVFILEMGKNPKSVANRAF